MELSKGSNVKLVGSIVLRKNAIGFNGLSTYSYGRRNTQRSFIEMQRRVRRKDNRNTIQTSHQYKVQTGSPATNEADYQKVDVPNSPDTTCWVSSFSILIPSPGKARLIALFYIDLTRKSTKVKQMIILSSEKL